MGWMKGGALWRQSQILITDWIIMISPLGRTARRRLFLKELHNLPDAGQQAIWEEFRGRSSNSRTRITYWSRRTCMYLTAELCPTKLIGVSTSGSSLLASSLSGIILEYSSASSTGKPMNFFPHPICNSIPTLFRINSCSARTNFLLSRKNFHSWQSGKWVVVTGGFY